MSLDRSFASLSPQERRFLEEGAHLLRFQHGGVAIKEGDRLRELLVVKSGVLRVTRVNPGYGLLEFVAPLGPGDIVGELSFVDCLGASATLVADGEAELLRIEPPLLDALQNDDPTFMGRFYKDLFLHLARRLRATNVRVTELT